MAWYKRVKLPNEQTEDVAQLFLGVRMQCAQCHHHPFERWSQNDYIAFTAFFSQVGRKPTAIAGEDLIFHKRGTAQMKNKKTKENVMPAALGQTPVDIAPDDDPRLHLANWMSEESNPFFATALVNRYWKHFFRRGLVEPEDDIRDTNPATNPELLAALANHFVESGFDLKEAVRVITQSQTYQLSAMPNEHNAVDRQNFSHFYPKRMQAEVLLDAIDELTGGSTKFADLPAGTRAVALPDNSYNIASPFLKIFGRPEAASVCECERAQAPSLGQSLHLMNSSDVKAKLASSKGTADTLSQPDAKDTDGIHKIYLAAFSRKPTGEELSMLDAIDELTGGSTKFADLPAGTRAVALPDNSYNIASPFLKIFGRPEAASVCECERAQAPSLGQSLHLMNSSDVKAKLASSKGTADTLSQPDAKDTDGIHKIYLAAFSRKPTGEELSIAEAYLAKPRTDAAGKALDPQKSKRQGYEDLLWAIMNTKEFLYNH